MSKFLLGLGLIEELLLAISYLILRDVADVLSPTRRNLAADPKPTWCLEHNGIGKGHITPRMRLMQASVGRGMRFRCRPFPHEHSLTYSSTIDHKIRYSVLKTES